MSKPSKESLRKMRKAVGRGYAAAVIEILHKEFSYPDVTAQEVYDVAHGKLNNEVILKAFLTHVVRVAEAAADINSLTQRALKAITENNKKFLK